MGCKFIGGVGILPTAKEVHWYGSWSDNCHHQIMVLVESVIKRVKSERESSFWIFIRHPYPLIFGKTLIKSLEESANLVFIDTSTK